MKFIPQKLVVLFLLSSVAMPASSAPTAYVPLGAKNEIAVIDIDSGTVTDRIPEVINPHGLAITPDQRYLIAGTFITMPPEQGGTPPKPSGVTEKAHKKHHSMSSKDGKPPVRSSFVSIVDLATKQVIYRVEVMGAVHHTAVTADSRYAIATQPTAGGISVIDLQSRKVIKVIPTGPVSNYAVVSKDGKRVYVSNAGNNTVTEINTQDWSVTRNLATGAAPGHIVLSPDENELYVNNVGAGSVSVITLDEGMTRRLYHVGAAPHGIDLSNDGRTLFVAGMGENQLVAIDLVSGEQQNLPLEPAPFHIASIKGAGTLYVSSSTAEKIWEIDQKSLKTVRTIELGGIGHQITVAN